jgi:hypothetical protein
MDQKLIVLYLRMKGMALDAIRDNLVRTLGKDPVAYSTVTKYVRRAQFSSRKEATSPGWEVTSDQRNRLQLLRSGDRHADHD